MRIAILICALALTGCVRLEPTEVQIGMPIWVSQTHIKYKVVPVENSGKSMFKRNYAGKSDQKSD